MAPADAKFSFPCPICHKSIGARHSLVGKKARCGSCLQAVVVPAQAPSPASAPTRPPPPVPAPATPLAAPAAALMRPWSGPRPARWVEPDAPLAEYLDAIARPGLYTTNAFRIAELDPSATPEEANRHIDKLDKMIAYGGAGRKRQGPMPVEPPPTAEMLREARGRLADACRRLLDELFWFEACGPVGADPVRPPLERGDVSAAEQALRQVEPGGPFALAALHNLAVLYHLVALDWERCERPEPRPRDYAWKQALHYWGLVLASEPFWRRLALRVQELNDARMQVGAVRQVRAALPGVLLAINAQLAAGAAAKGQQEDARRQVELIRAARMEGEWGEKVMRWVAAPLRERIDALAKAAPVKADADPVSGDEVAEELFDQSQPLLEALDCLLGAGDPVRDGAQDEIALAVLLCQVRFANKTENWARSLKLLKRARAFAVSESARGRIDENLTIVRENNETGSDWCAAGYFDLPPKALEVLEQARGFAKARAWEQAIPPLEGLLEDSDSPLPDDGAPIVGKALAYCLNGRAVDVLNRAVEQSNVLPEVIVRALANRSFGGLFGGGGLLGGGLAGLLGRMSCGACGGVISDTYTKFTVKGIEVNVCLTCSAQANREQAQHKATLRESVKEVARDLLEAAEQDPTNPNVQENLTKLNELAREVGASVPNLDRARCPGCERMMTGLCSCAHCGHVEWAGLSILLVLGTLALGALGYGVFRLWPSIWSLLLGAAGVGLIAFAIWVLSDAARALSLPARRRKVSPDAARKKRRRA